MNDYNDLIPPDQLVRQNEIGIQDFCGIGESMIKGLAGRGLIAPTSRVLDVGCGLGRLARPLVRYLTSGDYYGFDINQSSIRWCQSNYAPYTNFHFDWVDAYSKFYNPEGGFHARNYKFPFPDEFFDFAMLTSVFTHMMWKDVENYLAETARVLKPKGPCYITYFLLTPELSRAFATQPQYSLIDGGYAGDKNVPERVVFLREDLLKELYARNGLLIESIGYGTWSGKKGGGYQDEIVARKAAHLGRRKFGAN